MKKAPTIQYEMANDAGGTRVVTSANHPRRRRIGLLIDSLSTSTYGHSLVRIGGTLYRTPIIHNDSAEKKNSRFTESARPKPTAASSSHSAYARPGRTRPDGTGRKRLSG